MLMIRMISVIALGALTLTVADEPICTKSDAELPNARRKKIAKIAMKAGDVIW